MTAHALEIRTGERFEFGNNWMRFLRVLNDQRIETAEQSLRSMLNLESLEGLRFLDIGSGSGLFSLAARRLGATVHSFDYDPSSVACGKELRRRFFPNDTRWTIEEGSALDPDYLRSLGQFDIVYSWGVLHHTGDMWRALDLAKDCVRPGGALYVAIYNDMGAISRRWVTVKRMYCALPSVLQPLYAAGVMLPFEAKKALKALLRGRPQEYVHTWTRYSNRRGMSRWHDIVDWVGGYPYEYASPAQITDFYASRGFRAERVVPGGGIGCGEFVFRDTRD